MKGNGKKGKKVKKGLAPLKGNGKKGKKVKRGLAPLKGNGKKEKGKKGLADGNLFYAKNEERETGGRL